MIEAFPGTPDWDDMLLLYADSQAISGAEKRLAVQVNFFLVWNITAFWTFWTFGNWKISIGISFFSTGTGAGTATVTLQLCGFRF